jgi:hypothetical protein
VKSSLKWIRTEGLEGLSFRGCADVGVLWIQLKELPRGPQPAMGGWGPHLQAWPVGHSAAVGQLKGMVLDMVGCGYFKHSLGRHLGDVSQWLQSYS